MANLAREGTSGVDSGGTAGAGSPSPMENGAPEPSVQGRQFSSPFADYFGPESTFAPKALYGRLPAGEGDLLIRKRAFFSRKGALLNR